MLLSTIIINSKDSLRALVDAREVIEAPQCRISSFVWVATSAGCRRTRLDRTQISDDKWLGERLEFQFCIGN